MRYDRTPADQELVHPAYVVLDSNAWMQEWLLQTILGSKLVNLVVHLQARLLLPEIVEREITTKTILRAEEAVKKARAEINKISLLTQANFNPSLPDSEKMRSAVAGRLQELAGLIEREEFTFTTARAALERIFQKLPPCNQDNE